MASILARVVIGASLAAAATSAGGGVRGAEAQPKREPSAADKAEASRLVDEANAALDAKDYERSIELNQKANALVPHPIFLFNMAQAHRLAGRPAEAAALYDQYLVQAPNGNQAEAARTWLAETKAAAAKQAAEREAAEKAAAAAASSPAPGPSDPRTTGGAISPSERTDTAGHPGRTLRITGLVLGGVGLASVAFGAYNGLRVRSLDRDAEKDLEMGVPREAVLDKYEDDAKGHQTQQYIGYIVGGALVVGGVVTYLIGNRQGAAAQTTAWTPVVGPGYTGFAISGSL